MISPSAIAVCGNLLNLKKSNLYSIITRYNASQKQFNNILNLNFCSQSEHFPFLGNTAAISEMRCRSMFYTSLGRLLMVDLGEDEDRFDNFMMPLTCKLQVANLRLKIIVSLNFSNF
jgi:hypothetical protein